MKTIGKVIFNKTLFVILTIAIMLFSNFAPIISWAVEISGTNEEAEDEYVKFDLTWANGENEITSDAGTISAKFSLQFNTIETFKNFRVEVGRTDKVKVSYDNKGQYFDNSSSASQIQYLKDIPGGTRIDGAINFEFSKADDFQRYQKNLVVKLIGTYELDGEEFNVELTRNLLANITTPENTVYHQLELNVNSKVTEEKHTSSNTSELYVVSELIQTFYIDYKFVNSEYQKLEFNIYRTASNNDNIYYPDEVAFSDTRFSITKVDNGDGTYKYVAEGGVEHDEYEKGNLINYSKEASISARYVIQDAAEDIATTGKMYITLISKGYNVTTSESRDIGEKTILQKTGSNSKNTGIHSETTGDATWGNSYINTVKSAQTFYSKRNLEEFLEKDKMEVSYYTDIRYVSGRDSYGNTTITQNKRKIEHYDNNTSRYVFNDCTEDEMYVKKIEVDNMKRGENVWIKFYKEGESEPFFTATADKLTYEAQENERIGDYYAVLSNTLINRYTGWKTTYEICASSLKNKGLTDENIENIRTINVQQHSYGSRIYTKQEEATYYILEGNIENISAFSIDIRNANLNSNSSEMEEEVEGEIKLRLNNDGILSSDHKEFINVKNTNPIFYIELPEEFKFNINRIGITDINNRLKIKSYTIKKYNKKKVLIIRTEGQSNSINTSIDINYKRTLNSSCTSKNGILKVYMTTDEGIYFNLAEDINDYNQDGNNSDKIGYEATGYGIGYNAQIQLQNNVYSALNDVKNKEDVKLESGKTVKYEVTLNNDNNTIENISIVSRLPFIGNKSITGNSLIDLGTTVSLENLKNIEVYEKYNGQEIKLDSSDYEIGYSSEETANFETTFDTSESGIYSAKTLKIKMSDSYKLYKGNALIIRYELDIPEGAIDGKVASQISAAEYTDNESNTQTIEGVKSNVIVGSSAGTVEIVKQFEGENNTESVANIQFKITNMDDETKFYTGTTDANGHVIFENVPVGDYEITELTEFENYEAISLQYVTISNGEEYTEVNGKSILFENKMKMTKIEINKTWEDTNDVQSNDIEFEIQGTAVNGEEKTIKTTTYIEEDEEGNEVQKAIAYVPYGNYVIKETKGKYCWHSEDVNIDANQETLVVDIENKIVKGNIEIIKTVPEKETVEGLTFKITGIGDLSYINKEGNEVLFEKDFEVIIDETDENIQISEDKRTANIIIPNMPVGTYKITEINMPKVDTESGEVTRYVNVIKTVKVPDIQGETVSVPIENKHKTGILDINVTATEGANLEDFKVKVSGISYYGNIIDQIIDVPSTGKIRYTDFEIGKYKVEECNTIEKNGKIYTTNPDGFEVTYSPETANDIGVEVQYLRVTDVNIHNEYAAKGVVKIQKSLENETDISKAEGIEFNIKGEDFVGNTINEIITIGEDGTGTSNPIPVGNYSLTEVENKVSEIYELIEEQEITIKSENDESNPLTISLENKLAKGNIIIETELVTGGYPEEPVTYTVTKVNDRLEPVGEEVIHIKGDINSKAKLTDMKAGKYLVEQETVPEGYEKDTRQVVNITRNEYGYALFLIDKPEIEEFDNTTVRIQKDLVNEDGETAVTEDFIKAKLDIKESYSFEIRLKNTETNQIYYSFVENNKADTIKGLPYGTYEVEEVYKPKYKMLEITGDEITRNQEDGKYTFTLSESTSEIDFIVKNQIDTKFGFGGQDVKDNLSKILKEEVEQVQITKAKIYIRDEENQKVSDAKFKLYNSEGQVLKLSGTSGIYSISEEGSEEIKPKDGVITLKAFPIGDYKLINESVNSNLLRADEKIITVYSGAVGITRVELLNNVPRFNLRLSTTYTSDSGETKYVPRSNYKIVNKNTGAILTFIRKADGTWIRSKLPNATETISLKAGYSDIQGIEDRTYMQQWFGMELKYQVIAVGLSEKYGVVNETPEIISAQNQKNYEINVSAQDRTSKYKKIVNKELLIPDKGINTSVYSSSENVILKDIDKNCIGRMGENDNVSNLYVAITEDGKIVEYTNKGFSYCLLEDTVLYNDDIIIENIHGNSMRQLYGIDQYGKVWKWSYSEGYSYYKYVTRKSEDPICISETNGWENTKITEIYDHFAIDVDGKLWSWSDTEVTCISDTDNIRLKNVKLKKLVEIDQNSYFAIDTENKLWACGNHILNLRKDEMNDQYWNPICLNEKMEDNILSERGIIDIDITGKQNVLAIDEDGNLITWGYNWYGILGTGEIYNISQECKLEPNCITLTEKLRQVFAINVELAGAIDVNGDVWMWRKRWSGPKYL